MIRQFEVYEIYLTEAMRLLELRKMDTSLLSTNRAIFEIQAAALAVVLTTLLEKER